MANQQNNNQQGKNNNNFKNNLKETAGSAFHTVHNALQTTESAAMNTVDVTANAIGKVTGTNNNQNSEKN